MAILATPIMWVGYAQFYAAYVDGTGSGTLRSLSQEIWVGRVLFLLPALCLLYLLQILFALAQERLGGWRSLLTLPIAAVALVAVSYALPTVFLDETWWWRGLPLIGGTLPAFLVAAWAPPSPRWLWRVVQGALLLLATLLPMQFGLWVHERLPQEQVLLEQEGARREAGGYPRNFEPYPPTPGPPPAGP